jgi:hypothetical protein
MSKSADIGQILESITNKDSPDNLSVQKLVNEWFNPRPALMKHVIVIQMIACFIVSLFLIITAGDSLNPNSLMLAIMGFMLFTAASFGVYSKL